MALNNCSINSRSFTKTGGSAIGSNNAQLIIIPNAGYVVSASDFTNNTGAIAGINTITLSDSDIAGTIGNTVLVDIDLDDTYIMPFSNTELVIDIDGSAQLRNYSLNGSYNTTELGTTTTSNTTSYSAFGEYGEEVLVFQLTFTADTDKYFAQLPSYSIDTGIVSNYTITHTDTTDLDNRVTARSYTVKYEFQNEDIVGDLINFKATAVDIPYIATEITGYSIDNSSLTEAGETRRMQIFGGIGANFSVTVEDSALNSIASVTNQTIPPNGIYNFDITFPSNTEGETYTITISGDLSSAFDTVSGLPSSFEIVQLSKVQLIFEIITTNENITLPSDNIIFLQPNTSAFLTDDGLYRYDVHFDITSSTNMALVETIDETSFSNQNNDDLPFYISNFQFTWNEADDIDIDFTVNVYNTTTLSLTSTLDLDNYIEEVNTAPVAQAVSISVNKGGSTNITLVATDANNDTLTYNIVTLPSVGTLYSDAGLTNPIASPGQISGNIVYYLHDNSDNFDTSFTYKANDGYIDSNTANVNVAVGVSPGESVTASGAAGIYLIPIVLGTDAGTFKAHFNALSVPDRFQILFDTAGLSNNIADMEIVADSLWVGDAVVSDTSPFDVPSNKTVTGLDEFTYNGTSFDTTSTGTESYTIADTDVAANTGNRSTLAPNGPSRNSSGASQINVQNLVYTNPSDTVGLSDLNYADGNIALTYAKGITTSYRAYIRVFGEDGTAWNLHQTEFN